MKIIPSHSILIAGQHCEAGQPIEVADSLGRLLIAERQAKRAPVEAVEPTPAPAPEAEASSPEVETAAVEPTVEAAATTAKPTRKAKA